MRRLLLVLPALGLLVADEPHRHGLGRSTSRSLAAPAAQKTFERGVALLHSFWYDEAEKDVFRSGRTDPGCAMAYWGIAMSLYHPVWAPPTPADLKKGAAAVAKAKSAAGKNPARARLHCVPSKSFTEIRRSWLTGSARWPGAMPCSSSRRDIRKTAKPLFSSRFH